MTFKTYQIGWDEIKISFKTGKTKLVLFTSPKKQLSSELEIKLNGEKAMKMIHLNIWEFKLIITRPGNSGLITWLLK